MTNNKKTYITPKALFINLEEETNLLAGSVIVVDEETEEGTPEKYVFGIMGTDYNSIGASTAEGTSEIWK